MSKPVQVSYEQRDAPVRPPHGRISVYLRPEDELVVRRAARNSGQNASEYIRQAVSERIERETAGD